MPLTINDSPVAKIVKAATQRFHSDVEDLLLPKLSSVQSIRDYAIILKMFYGYFRPVENLIQQHLTPLSLPDINERRKALAILQDLSAIGYSSDQLQYCFHLPKITNEAQAFGALYVLEGSTLGGKMIAKMLLKNQHLSLPENALHFFSGYKEQTGNKWTTFLEVFNQQQAVEEIVASANDTFFYLKCWMQNPINNG